MADGAKAFGDALNVNKTLTEIDLSDNEIGAEIINERVKFTIKGTAALAKGLKMNTTVTKVRVQNILSKGYNLRVLALGTCLLHHTFALY